MTNEATRLKELADEALAAVAPFRSMMGTPERAALKAIAKTLAAALLALSAEKEG